MTDEVVNLCGSAEENQLWKAGTMKEKVRASGERSQKYCGKKISGILGGDTLYHLENYLTTSNELSLGL